VFFNTNQGESIMDGLLTLIDFETTSKFKDEARATEIGMIALDFNFKEVARFETLIRPPTMPSRAAQEVSGISSSMLLGAQPFSSYWPEIAPFLSNRILVAYNANFDMQILANELNAMQLALYPPAICAYRMADRCFPKSMAGDHKLPTLTRYFGIEHDAHEALGDVLATAELLKIMLKKFPHENELIVQAATNLVPISIPEKLAIPVLLRSDVSGQSKIGDQPTDPPYPVQPVRDLNEIKQIAKSVVASNKPYVALTGNPSMGKIKFAEMAKKLGLEYSRNPVGKRVTALLVVGIEEIGQTKIHDANKHGVPIINNYEWIAMCDLSLTS